MRTVYALCVISYLCCAALGRSVSDEVQHGGTPGMGVSEMLRSGWMPRTAGARDLPAYNVETTAACNEVCVFVS